MGGHHVGAHRVQGVESDKVQEPRAWPVQLDPQGQRIHRPHRQPLGGAELPMKRLGTADRVEHARVLAAGGGIQGPPPARHEVLGGHRPPVAPTAIRAQVEGPHQPGGIRLPAPGRRGAGLQGARIAHRQALEQRHGDARFEDAGHQRRIQGLGLGLVVEDEALGDRLPGVVPGAQIGAPGIRIRLARREHAGEQREHGDADHGAPPAVRRAARLAMRIWSSSTTRAKAMAK
jgi:hypothetical protein